MTDARSQADILQTSPPFRTGRLAACVFIAVIMWIQPPPEGLSLSGWRIFAVFIATIAGFILRPLPMAPLVLMALAVLVLADALSATHYLDLDTAFSGFANSTTWLVVLAILLSGTVVRTQLGTRLALFCFSTLGRTTSGLGYAICLTELLLAPFIPSNTARGGGIIAPVVRSINEALTVNQTVPIATQRFLVSCGAHANLIASAMFLTAMAANPLVANAASEVYGIQFTWFQWFLGAIVPGILGLAFLPLILQFLFKPSPHPIGNARNTAKDRLREMGHVSRNEFLLILVFLGMISLWISSPWHGIPTTAVCLGGVVSILVLRMDHWQKMIGQTEAWDTLVWLGGLLTMANALKNDGVVQYFSQLVDREITQIHPWVVGCLLALIYFYSMYGFSMLTGHIIALAAAFLLIAQQADTPALLIVPLIAYFSSLCGCLTNYSTGPLIIYFNQGHIPPATWFRTGFVISIFHLTIWYGIGLPYWKLLGWW